MDDRTALLRAVIAAPDDDFPRLVFADWLEELDENEAFIRAQIETANKLHRHFGDRVIL